MDLKCSIEVLDHVWVVIWLACGGSVLFCCILKGYLKYLGIYGSKYADMSNG